MRCVCPWLRCIATSVIICSVVCYVTGNYGGRVVYGFGWDASPLFSFRPQSRHLPLQHASQGVRVSDPATVDVAEMVLCGSINKGIASSIKRAGGRAVGLSGKDDNLLVAKKLGKQVVDEATGEVKVTLLLLVVVVLTLPHR